MSSVEETRTENGIPPQKQAHLAGRILTFLLFSRRGLAILSLAAVFAIFIALLPTGTRLTMLASLYHQRGLVTLLLVFVLLSLSLIWTAGQNFDLWLFTYINQRGYRSKWLDRVMFIVTQVGNGAFSFVLVLALYLVDMRRLALVVLVGTLTLWIVVEILKLITERARPFTMLSEAVVVGWRERGRSFPSGHSSQTFFMASILSNHFQQYPYIPVLLYAVALLVALSRVYIGVHYPRDVLGGAVLGSVWGILVVLVQPFWLAP